MATVIKPIIPSRTSVDKDNYITKIYITDLGIQIGNAYKDILAIDKDIEQGLSAKVTEEATARIEGDTAVATRIDTVESDYMSSDADLQASITTEEQTRVNADTAISTRIDTVESNYQSDVAKLSSDITTEINTRTSENETTATRIDTVESNFQSDMISINGQLSTTNARITTEENTRATNDEAISSRIDTVESNYKSGVFSINSQITSTNARITTEENTRANADEANATRIDTVESNLQTALGSEKQARATADTTLNTYVGIDNSGNPTGTGALADIQILQKQNDGVIETTTGTYDVMIGVQDPNNNTDDDQLDTTQEPYATWISTDTANGNTVMRSSHIGDVYIKYSSATTGYKTYEKAYKFIKTTVDTTNPYSTDADGFTWALITDTDVQNAYVTALNAYDLADDKRRVFVAEPTAPYDEGDLWIDSLGTYKVVKSVKPGIHRATGFLASEWAIADEQATQYADAINPKVATLQNQVDGKIEYYFYDNPTNHPSSDLISGWGEAENGNVIYYTDTDEGYWYSSKLNSLLALVDTSMLSALKKANDARNVADSKINSYYIDTFANTQALSDGWTTAEKSTNEGDIATVYADSTTDNNGTWRWNGTGWQTTRDKKLVALATQVTDLNTELTNGTTTWANADSSLENTLNASISNGDAKVESKFAYNSNLTLNGVTYNSGFGLASLVDSGNGTGTSEFWINADKFKFTDGKGSVNSQVFTADSINDTVTFNGDIVFNSNSQRSVEDIALRSTSEDIPPISTEIDAILLEDDLSYWFTFDVTYNGWGSLPRPKEKVKSVEYEVNTNGQSSMIWIPKGTNLDSSYGHTFKDNLLLEVYLNSTSTAGHNNSNSNKWVSNYSNTATYIENMVITNDAVGAIMGTWDMNDANRVSFMVPDIAAEASPINVMKNSAELNTWLLLGNNGTAGTISYDDLSAVCTYLQTKYKLTTEVMFQVWTKFTGGIWHVITNADTLQNAVINDSNFALLHGGIPIGVGFWVKFSSLPANSNIVATEPSGDTYPSIICNTTTLFMDITTLPSTICSQCTNGDKLTVEISISSTGTLKSHYRILDAAKNEIYSAPIARTPTAPFYVDPVGATVVSTQKGTPLVTANDVSSAGSTVISGDRIKTGVITVDKLSAYQLPYPTWSGTVMDKDGLKVYQNGNIRVKLGKLY